MAIRRPAQHTRILGTFCGIGAAPPCTMYRRQRFLQKLQSCARAFTTPLAKQRDVAVVSDQRSNSQAMMASPAKIRYQPNGRSEFDCTKRRNALITSSAVT